MNQFKENLPIESAYESGYECGYEAGVKAERKRIVDEILICRKEGMSTSQLISLVLKVHEKNT